MKLKLMAIVLIVVTVLTMALPAFAASHVYAKYDGVGIWEDPDEMGASPMCYVPYGGKITLLDSSTYSGCLHVSYNGYYGWVDKGDVTSKNPFEPTPTPKPTKTAKPTKKATSNPTKKATSTPTKAPSLYGSFEFVDKYVKVSLNKSGSQLNMRWAPTTGENNIIASYDNGTILHAIAISDGWVQVLDEENWCVGFMAADYLIDAEESEIPTNSNQNIG